ncbi:ABC transporter substrate-binding protein [Aureibacillus halotolerans]|uniref:Peptide/nickel transport system substrate-binding protein n=1 Tax=Aureibacillus halotolerans TaxID=1508390 RepID=A0A4R6U799_9BACI|nr:ABC transporter substrate-binding protein [Aureibacillus halotolerans]TDQ40773.1 peptide/nickel transport system substrate-binding protein [Aureibacillus halotolerans]
MKSTLFFVRVQCVLLVVLLALSACSKAEETNSNRSEVNNEQEISEKSVEEVFAKDFPTPERSNYLQSPTVEKMDLPPVQQRLPDNPKITNEMTETMLDYQIGNYGGTLNTVTGSVNWDADVFVMNVEPLLNTPGILGEEITGNVLEGYEVTPDQKTFTFHLRKGLKWSDGEPVTMEDVRFAVEDVLFNEELMPTFPSWLRASGKASGEPMSFNVIDEESFTISFTEPYGGFPMRLAIEGWRNYHDFIKPAHYLKPFHKTYADPEALTAAIEEADFETDENGWINLFNKKDVISNEMAHPEAVGFPVLYPWTLVENNKTTMLFQRNPYYFKVDVAGKQLPYIDEIRSEYVQDMEIINLKVLSGEVDFAREATALNKMALYKKGEENGGYQAGLYDMHITPTDFFLNMTYEDPTWREVVRDERFREALNLALNKEEIIDTMYYGLTETSDFISDEFNVQKANQLLDDMGMKMGTDGYRKAPNGEDFSIPFVVQDAAPDIVPLTQIIVQQWEALGLNVSMRTIDGALWGTRNAANELQATMIWTHTPLWYMADWGVEFWGPLWESWWLTNGAEGEEPPDDVKEFYQLLDKLYTTPTEQAGTEVFAQIREEMGDHLWYFTPIQNVKQPLIFSKNLRNLAEEGYAIGLNFSGEQFFFADPSKE